MRLCQHLLTDNFSDLTTVRPVKLTCFVLLQTAYSLFGLNAFVLPA